MVLYCALFGVRGADSVGFGDWLQRVVKCEFGRCGLAGEAAAACRLHPFRVLWHLRMCCEGKTVAEQHLIESWCNLFADLFELDGRT